MSLNVGLVPSHRLRWILLQPICPGDLEPGRWVGHAHPQVALVEGHQVLAVPKAFRIVVVEFPDLVGVEGLPFVKSDIRDGTITAIDLSSDAGG